MLSVLARSGPRALGRGLLRRIADQGTSTKSRVNLGNPLTAYCGAWQRRRRREPLMQAAVAVHNAIATVRNPIQCLSEMSPVYCRDCGRPLATEGIAAPPQSTPCPQCGSVRRKYTEAAQACQVVTTVKPVDVEVIDYPRLLLREAQNLVARGQHGIAVVVAHMACEAAVQRALSAAFVKRNIGDLEESISQFFSGYNLGNDRLRAFYTALTGDRIEGAQFWKAFKESVAHRNRIIHAGRTATEADAQASIDAARWFVEHVSRQWR